MRPSGWADPAHFHFTTYINEDSARSDLLQPDNNTISNEHWRHGASLGALIILIEVWIVG